METGKTLAVDVINILTGIINVMNILEGVKK